jgi:fumarylacetoacetase
MAQRFNARNREVSIMHREIDETHDPQRRSWIRSANDVGTDFPIQNLPLGSISIGGEQRRRVGVRIGDRVLDVTGVAGGGLLAGHPLSSQLRDAEEGLAAILHAEPVLLTQLRQQLSALLSTGAQSTCERLIPHLRSVEETTLHLPARIGTFTDFMASSYHAGRGRPLVPNFKHLPIGYTSRASTVMLSGQSLERPWGQYPTQPTRFPPSSDDPAPDLVFAPTQALDYEMELGALLGRAGRRIPIDNAAEHVFGYVLLNDWSARDIQFWEMFPLGPFAGKSMGTSISPWVVTPDALVPFRDRSRAVREEDPKPLPYLLPRGGIDRLGINLEMEVAIASQQMRQQDVPPLLLGRSNFLYMYWNFEQMIAHCTAGGCDIQTGDLLGSGTVSGPELEETGCLAELQSRGPVTLPSGETRRWVQDGDEVVMRATARRDGFIPIGFGELRTRVTPARPWEQ